MNAKIIAKTSKRPPPLQPFIPLPLPDFAHDRSARGATEQFQIQEQPTAPAARIIRGRWLRPFVRTPPADMLSHEFKQAGVNLHMIDLGGDTTGNGAVLTILSARQAERDRTRERNAEVKRNAGVVVVPQTR